MSLIDPLLAEVLVCPSDLGDLEENIAGAELVCTVCRRRYPVREGIPIMLPTEETDDE